MSNKFIYIGGNSLPSFSSSILTPDIFNRFGAFLTINKAVNLSSVFDSIFIEFNFKLPFNNLLSKFKNRIHFLLYFLFFELLVSQKPKILVHRERLANLASFKNKREIKKAKESIGIKSFSFNVSLLKGEQLDRFLVILAFFIAPFTNKKLNPPSKYVEVSLLASAKDSANRTSSGALLGVIKNLAIFPCFNLIDDLSASSSELKITMFPAKLKVNKFIDDGATLPNKMSLIGKQICCFAGSSYGLAVEDSANLFNLRFFKF